MIFTVITECPLGNSPLRAARPPLQQQFCETRMKNETRIELRHLRYFAVICKEGSAAAAARQLRVTPQTVNHRIRELERILKVKLLVRQHRGLVAPTDAGKIMRAHSRSILKYLAVATEALRKLNQPVVNPQIGKP